MKWRGGDGAGHVAWGFDLPDGRVCIGSVENHSGHVFTPAKDMGFWLQFAQDVVPPLQERSYDDAAIFEVPQSDYVSAYRVTQWIKHSAYRAFSRNCEDDAYDVLRAYGVEHLEAPFFNWFPRWWFSKLRATKTPIAQLRQFSHGQVSTYHAEPVEASPPERATSSSDTEASRIAVMPTSHGEVSGCHPEESKDRSGNETLEAQLQSLPPLHPQWRKPFHLESQLLNLAKFTRLGVRKL